MTRHALRIEATPAPESGADGCTCGHARAAHRYRTHGDGPDSTTYLGGCGKEPCGCDGFDLTGDLGWDVEASCRPCGWHWLGWEEDVRGAAAQAAAAFADHLAEPAPVAEGIAPACGVRGCGLVPGHDTYPDWLGHPAPDKRWHWSEDGPEAWNGWFQS